MPLITIDGPKLSLEQKEKLCAELSKRASEIMEIPMDAFVMFVKENQYENMSQGGVLISEKLKRR